MKSRRLIAALLASSAAPLAFAQDPPVSPPAPKPVYVQEPIASDMGSGPNAEVAKAVAQALNADASLKQSKLSVVAEERGVLVTGVTPTLKQMARAMQIAQQAGGDSVNAVIHTEELFIDAPHPVATLEVLEPAAVPTT